VNTLRLLDLVAQSTAAAPTLPVGWRFPRAHHFAGAVRTCPLRLVLADDLIRYTTELAYAEGDRLCDCLDLIHVPAQHLWLEWLEATRQATLRDIPTYAGPSSGVEAADCRNVRRTGLLISADPVGRSGSIRTFWSTPADQVHAAALITDFNLDRTVRPALHIDGVFRGDGFGVVMPVEASLDALLSHVCFRLDPAWVDYYRAANLTREQQFAVVRALLGSMAFDTPMIMALFLLFAAKEGLQRRAADLQRLNQARRRSGKPPLLEHLEVRAPIASSQSFPEPLTAGATRRCGPRLHHVRGHIARRGDKVFWRLPHLRGSVHLGVVRSRTVQLSCR
jgi:hypothetical protein